MAGKGGGYMSNPDYILIPCVIEATTKTGFRVKTGARDDLEVPRSDVVPTHYGWGLVVRGEKGAENEN